MATPLTQTDIQGLLGAFLGGLISGGYAPTETVRAAVMVWAHNEQAWEILDTVAPIGRELAERAVEAREKKRPCD